MQGCKNLEMIQPEVAAATTVLLTCAGSFRAEMVEDSVGGLFSWELRGTDAGEKLNVGRAVTRCLRDPRGLGTSPDGKFRGGERTLFLGGMFPV